MPTNTDDKYSNNANTYYVNVKLYNINVLKQGFVTCAL